MSLKGYKQFCKEEGLKECRWESLQSYKHKCGKVEGV